MATPDRSTPPTAGHAAMSLPDRLTALVGTVLGHETLAGLVHLVRRIAEVSGADGCVVWLPRPGVVQGEPHQQGGLYTAAQWFRNGSQWAIHDLELHTVTGQTLREGNPQYVADVEKEARINHRATFFSATKTKAFYTVPTHFGPGDTGVIGAYKQQPDSFDKRDFEFFDECARLVPDLWKMIHNSVTLLLMEKVSHRLSEAEFKSGSSPLPQSSVEAVLQDVCKWISAAVHADETSIFFEDWLTRPGHFSLKATTWFRFGDTGEYPRLDPETACPIGLTTWSLFHGRAIHIFDLSRWEEDQDYIQGRFANIRWRNPINVGPVVAQYRDVPEKSLPPLSFMAAPLRLQDRVLGVIRCCAASEPPFFYSGEEVRLLQRVAMQLAHFWSAWLGRRELTDGIERMTRVQADLAHQLKTPLHLAHSRLQTLARRTANDSELKNNILEARSVISRARQITLNLRVYVELHRAGKIVARSLPAYVRQINDLVREAVEDTDTALDPQRELRFRVEFSGAETARVSVDLDLFGEVIYVLLDNATKYSYSNTTISVSTGFTSKGKHFHVTIRNKSERISKADLVRLTDRGFRTETASLWTQDGSGLGLWIVKHVVDAHAGQLLLHSERGGEFVAKLLFPT